MGDQVLSVPWARPYFDSAERDLVDQTMASGWLSQGSRVEALESRMSQLTGSPYCVAVNNGTSALDVALKLMGVNSNDKIMVPAFAYIASVNCVLYQGASPVFVDVDPNTFTVSIESARERVTPDCKGMIVIDYGGQAAHWEELRAFASEHGLFLIEDAAPAMGGTYRGKSLGTLGDIGTTSFHAAKTFTSVEGGMLFLTDPELDYRARVIRSQGESPDEKYEHIELGHNYRLSDLHASVGLAQLQRYDEVLADRAAAANYYAERLSDLSGVTLPQVEPGNRHGWFLYSVLTEERNAIKDGLALMGVGTNVSWPRPAYEHPYLREYYSGPCPITEELCRRVLALPLYYQITRSELDHVTNALEEVVTGLLTGRTATLR